jgi:hypothetical protein
MIYSPDDLVYTLQSETLHTLIHPRHVGVSGSMFSVHEMPRLQDLWVFLSNVTCKKMSTQKFVASFVYSMVGDSLLPFSPRPPDWPSYSQNTWRRAGHYSTSQHHVCKPQEIEVHRGSAATVSFHLRGFKKPNSQMVVASTT